MHIEILERVRDRARMAAHGAFNGVFFEPKPAATPIQTGPDPKLLAALDIFGNNYSEHGFFKPAHFAPEEFFVYPKNLNAAGRVMSALDAWDIPHDYRLCRSNEDGELISSIVLKTGEPTPNFADSAVAKKLNNIGDYVLTEYLMVAGDRVDWKKQPSLSALNAITNIVRNQHETHAEFEAATIGKPGLSHHQLMLEKGLSNHLRFVTNYKDPIVKLPAPAAPQPAPLADQAGFIPAQDLQ